MPFRAIGDAAGQRIFSEGLTEDPVTALTGGSDIRVITGNPRGGQARYLFEGSVRGGTKLRITAQLIDTRTGFHLWGGRYDRTLSDPQTGAAADLLAHQSEISAKIVKTLTEKLALIRAQQREQAEGAGVLSILFSGLEMIGRVLEETIDMPGDLYDRLRGKSP